MGKPKLMWTPEMDATLLALRGRLHAVAVAERIGVSVHSMYRRLRELGEPLRRCTRRKKGATVLPVAPAYYQPRKDPEHAQSNP